METKGKVVGFTFDPATCPIIPRQDGQWSQEVEGGPVLTWWTDEQLKFFRELGILADLWKADWENRPKQG